MVYSAIIANRYDHYNYRHRYPSSPQQVTIPDFTFDPQSSFSSPELPRLSGCFLFSVLAKPFLQLQGRLHFVDKRPDWSYIESQPPIRAPRLLDLYQTTLSPWSMTSCCFVSTFPGANCACRSRDGRAFARAMQEPAQACIDDTAD